jgi:hypothetical protein
MAQTNKAKYTVIKCTGEAHSNAFIDNCSLCAPNWGVIVLPPQFKSLDEYREYCFAVSTNAPARTSLKRTCARAQKAYRADKAEERNKDQ